MKRNDLELAAGLSVPVGIAARTVFIAGTKGSGKTYTAGVLVEGMLAADVHVVVLDPLGVWWGLRSPAEDEAAQGRGGFPVLILGGEHGDQPLLPSAGEIVADFIVRSGQSVVLDLSKFDSDAEQDRFVTALLKKLFRLKSADKANLHLVMDEADLFAPQQPQPGQMAMLGAARAIVTKARSRGLSMTMISQRPQAVSKACIDEADVVLCHRIMGPRPAKAMREWVEQHASGANVREFIDSLPGLANGEAWVWSPQFLNYFGRHQVRRKRTFDSSRTPEPGEVARKPTASAAVDLAKLTTEMAAAAEQAKADDPRELRRQIAELTKQAAAKLGPAAPAHAKIETKVIDRPVVEDRHVESLTAMIGELDKTMRCTPDVLGELDRRMTEAKRVSHEIWTGIESLRDLVRETRTLNTTAVDGVMSLSVRKRHGAPAGAKDGTPRRPPLPDWPGRPYDKGQTLSDADAAGMTLTAAQKRLLSAAAWWRSIGVDAPTRAQVAFVARIKPTGGHFSNSIGPLVTNGLLENVAGAVRLTPAGAAAAPPPDAETTLKAYHAAVREVLATGAQRTLFDAIVANGVEGILVAALGEKTGINPAGGHFSNSIGPLGTLGLVERRQGVVFPTSLLFPEELT